MKKELLLAVGRTESHMRFAVHCIGAGDKKVLVYLFDFMLHAALG